jgi:hypothetical protein
MDKNIEDLGRFPMSKEAMDYSMGLLDAAVAMVDERNSLKRRAFPT